MRALPDSDPRLAFAHRFLRPGLASFVLSLGWEWGQLSAYRCPASGLKESLVLLLPAVAGDVALTFVLILFAVAVQRRRACPFRLRRRGTLAFLVGGAGLAIAVELVALATESWSYSALMPLIPGLRVGWLPVLHGMTVPLVSVFLACPARPSLVFHRGEMLSDAPPGAAPVQDNRIR